MLEYITAACSVCLLFWGQLQSTIQKSGLLMQVSAARPSHSFSCSLFPSLLPPLSRLSLSPSHTYISILFFSTKTLVPSRPPILLLCRFPFSPYLIMFNILYLPFFPLLVLVCFLSFSFFRFNSTFSLFSLSLPLLSYSLYFSPRFCSVSPGSHSYPIFYCLLPLSSSHPSISPTSHPSLPPSSLLFSSPTFLHSLRLFFLFLSLSQDNNLTHGLLISESNTQTCSQRMAHESALWGFETHMQLCACIQDSRYSVHTPKLCIEYGDDARMINTRFEMGRKRKGEDGRENVPVDGRRVL